MTYAPAIVSVASIDCSLAEGSWPFAEEHAAAIDRHWQARLERQPALFNGRVLVLHDGQTERGRGGEDVFRGACIAVDFKAFLAWREFGLPGTGVRNIFSMAAIETADGAFLLGEMGAHTAPAGQIYFPSGTPDMSDVRGSVVDIDGSARRELREETGLGSDDVFFDPGMTLVMDPVRVCCMKRVRVSEDAEALQTRIHAWLSQDPTPELARMHIVRGTSDIVPAMPDFVAAYLRHRFAAR